MFYIVAGGVVVRTGDVYAFRPVFNRLLIAFNTEFGVWLTAFVMLRRHW
jgi:hypothetical protein